MGNEGNLKPVRTAEEAREMGRRGGIKSGEARRRKRDMKKAAQLLMGLDIKSKKLQEQVKGYGLDDEDVNNQMAVLVSMFVQATKGNVRAAEFIRDTMGENPVHKLKKKELELKIAEFEYKKERDAGISQEIEDLDEIEEEIYGKDRESKEDQEGGPETEENDTV